MPVTWLIKTKQFGAIMSIQEKMIEIVVNGVARQIGANTTLELLVEQLKLVPQQVAIEVNRQLVPRGAHPNRRLQAGDQLEIVSLTGGG